MALPLRIVAALRLATRDKWILACLFGVTSIAIVVSTVRVFLIYAKTGTGTPSPPWLGLWAVIEGMVGMCFCFLLHLLLFDSYSKLSSSAVSLSSPKSFVPAKRFPQPPVAELRSP